MKPRFAIVTVSKCDARGLQATRESVLSQTYGAWTHLIQEWVPSGEVATNSVGEDDARLHHFKSHDRGVYDAMNLALAHLPREQVELVVFLNSGDQLAGTDVLCNIASSWRLTKWNWAVGDVSRWGAFIGPRKTSTYDVQPWQILLGLRTVDHPGCIVSTDLLMRVGGFDPGCGLAADQDFILRCLDDSRPERLAFTVSRFAPGGMSSRQSRREREMDFHFLRRKRASMILDSERLDLAFARGMPIARWLRRRPAHLMFALRPDRPSRRESVQN